MEMNCELTAYPLSKVEHPKIERHMAKYMKYYILGIQLFIYIIVIIAYNVIISILGSSETKIELTWYFILAKVVPNLILSGVVIYTLIIRYSEVKVEADKAIIKRVQQRIQRNNPCVILFNNDSFTIMSEEFEEKGKQIEYRDSEWITAQEYIICISHNIIVNNISEDVISILQSKLF